MPNQYFKFKQFTVHQDQCAMKVCTDACIQGAFTAARLAGAPPPATVLDIGTGTGLLGLMLAQQLPAARITGVELDEAAVRQASANFAASPWAARLRVTQGDIRSWPASHAYDFIITNPPFYEADLKSADPLRNQAMHATTLNYTELLQAIDRQLRTGCGGFSILLPYQPFRQFRQQAAAAGFYPQEILTVRQSVQHDHFRAVGIFGRQEGAPREQELAIYDAQQAYTPAFTALLKAYYLYL